MKLLRAFAALPLLTAACCAPVPEPEPTPAPTPTPVATPSPTPTPTPVIQQPVYENWLDAPQTPGDWRYAADPSETFATFGQRGQPMTFLFRCDLRTKRVGFARPAAAGTGNTPARIRTETAQRLLTLTPRGGSRPLLVVELDPNDNLLDAIALSRGRFAVETGGMETLYLPAWPEITRVIEDCR